jgi:hypothetical protein
VGVKYIAMSKILVSSKSLALALKSVIPTELIATPLPGGDRGDAELQIKEGDVVVSRLIVKCDGKFHFNFLTSKSALRFRREITKMSEQPITLENNGNLWVTGVAVFK